MFHRCLEPKSLGKILYIQLRNRSLRHTASSIPVVTILNQAWPVIQPQEIWMSILERTHSPHTVHVARSDPGTSGDDVCAESRHCVECQQSSQHHVVEMVESNLDLPSHFVGLKHIYHMSPDYPLIAFLTLAHPCPITRELCSL